MDVAKPWRPASRPARRAARRSSCSYMSATSHRSTVPTFVEECRGALGFVGVDVHAQHALVADDQHRVAELLEAPTERGPVEALAALRRSSCSSDSSWTRAIGVTLRRNVQLGRNLVRYLVRVTPSPRRPAIRPEINSVTPYPPASTTPCSRKTGSSSGLRSSDFSAASRAFSSTCASSSSCSSSVASESSRCFSMCASSWLTRLAIARTIGDHRSLRRVAHRGVDGLRCACKRGRHELGIDQLAGAAGELLGGAAHHLRKDHAAVAAGAVERGTGNRLDDLVAADLIDHLTIQTIQLDHDGLECLRHVVARVPVSDREHVQVVHLLTPGLELGVGSGDNLAKANYRGIRQEAADTLKGLHARCRIHGGGSGQHSYQAALITLPAFRQRVQT